MLFTKIMQTSGKRACSWLPECSLAYTKVRIIYETIKPSCLYFHHPNPLMPASLHRLPAYAA